MPSPTAGVFAPVYRALTVGILLSITGVAFEGMSVATIMPSVAAELGGLEAYGWAFSAFMLASLVGATAAGVLADRRGLALPASAGFAAFALGLVASGAAPIWPLLLAGRAVQGFGAGALGSVAYVAVARGYPEALRPRLLAMLSSAWIVPSLIGPAIAGQVAEHATWRLVFFGLIPFVALGACTTLPALRRLPSAVTTSNENAARVLTSLRLMAGVGLILLAASLTFLPATIAAAAVGLVLAIPAFNALLPRGTVFARRGVPASVALRALLAFAFFGSEAVIPLGLSTERNLPPSVVGIALTVGALAWVAAAWLQDRLETRAHGSLQRRSARVVAGLILLGLGIGLAGLSVLLPWLPLVTVLLGWMLAGLGMGLTYPATTLTALGLARAGEEGQASASLQVAETVGIATGTGAAGALYALSTQLNHPAEEGLAWAFALSLAAAVVAIAAGARLAPTRFDVGARDSAIVAEPRGDVAAIP